MTKDPHQILGVDPDAEEATIRRHYLQLVREHPPDRDPERFRAIRQAYEQLRDPVARMRHRLFACETEDSLEMILADLQQQVLAQRIPTDALLSLAEQA